MSIAIQKVETSWRLSDYAAIAHLAEHVRRLRVEASITVPILRDRRVWMVNSTARGGGVAEMLPRMVALLRELGIETEWAVVETGRQEFFRLTKHIHNLVHGEGKPRLDAAARELYETENRRFAAALRPHLRPGDILVVHDPQPMAMAAFLRRELPLRTIWRCHIGFDEHNGATRAAWAFLKPWADAYDVAIFSAPEYIPDFFAGRATIIHPALDPCSHKNRELHPHKLTGILVNSSLKQGSHPVVTPPFSAPALRLFPDGEFRPATDRADIGLLYRPIVTQISRWDRLKGFPFLLRGFARLKEELPARREDLPPRHRRRLEILRLVLAGPDPASIQDDPEGQEVLAELVELYRGLPRAVQEDVALLTLPMGSRKENALMVNALQSCSTVVVQNSLREGFGLTATEAMWKGIPVLASRAYGLRQQIRAGIDGMLIQDPTDPAEIARRLDGLLADVPRRDFLARNARQRVHGEFLVFTQLCRWLRCLGDCAGAAPAAAAGPGGMDPDAGEDGETE